MSESIINDFEDMGVFTVPFDESVPMYDTRKIDEYCELHNKKPNELTDEELKMFQID